MRSAWMSFGTAIFAFVFVGGSMVASGAAGGAADMVLPPGVKAVWGLDRAYREKSPTRERVCINGLWQWQPVAPVPAPAPAGGTAGGPPPAAAPGGAPAGAAAPAAPGAATMVAVPAAPDKVPTDGWGYFKVPGCWPGITDYMQKDSQTVYAHPSWKDQRLGEVNSAWYQREITVPAEWTGRRITVYAEYVNSLATVYVDGAKAGEIRFPSGEVDLTSACRPGGKHVLTIYLQALPLRAVMLSYSDTVATRMVRGRVDRRGLCGDVYLVGAPAGPRVNDVKVDTSVRKGEIRFEAGLEGLAPNVQYSLRAQILDKGRGVGEFAGPAFSGADLKDGRTAFTAGWKAEKLWDIHTPQNMYEVALTLVGPGGQVLDASLPTRFGFREFWIDGKDFYLNGTRIYLSSVPLDNAQVGAAVATYDAVKDSLLRLKTFGINFVYTHNYGCEPGTHLTFEEELRAADDAGMVVALSQPHFSRYNWTAPDAEKTNGYAQHAAFYVRVAQNHPSVVFYSTSHNSTGYGEDMNPDMIDGIQDPHDMGPNSGPTRALRAEAIIKTLDPSRIVYHHSSGNLSSMHTANFYANWSPIQEMSDWFEHWATVGKKPVFTCEYGVPFTWDWTMYRGWYKGTRTFGSAVVPWEYCLAEWNSQFLGDGAYKISDVQKEDIRWEAQQFRDGKLWHRWDYPHQVGSREIDEQYPVFAMYMSDNWRAFRTWGMSANSPWEHGTFWKLRDGVDKGRTEVNVDWDSLQRPGLSPDYMEDRYERMDMAFKLTDWIATPAAEALYRNNMPLLAYIGGKPAAVTSKDHNSLPGQAVEKQLIIINNSRETATCDCQWSLALPSPVSGSKTITLATGQQERIPLKFDLPANLAPGRYAISATVKFGNGETQKDSFSIDVMPPQGPVEAGARIALFDPKGDTAALLKAMGVTVETVAANANLSGYDALIIGKAALTLDGPAPDISRVRDGLKVVIFEQTGEVLEKRFGFRIAEYGLRTVFRRVPDHPLLAGITDGELRDWRGDSTILPNRLTYETAGRLGRTVRWCDIPVTRVWRCGNRGNVASALIEKPACGDFLPILDGGYALQYASLLEYHEGKGMVLFCQTDVSGRTETDPAAEALARNILRYVSTWKPSPVRSVLYVGDPAGKSHLERTGLTLSVYEGGNLSPDQVLVVGPGGGQQLARNPAVVAGFLKAGGNLLAFGLDAQEANAFLPVKIATKNAEHIAAYFQPSGADSPLAGVSPADVHNRDPRDLPLVSGGATVLGDGVLAKAENANVVFCQLAPWQFDYSGENEKMNIKRTFRRISCLATRLLGNMGAAGRTPLLGRVSSPVAQAEKRWLEGFYLDTPEEWDDPYRFFRW